MQRLKWKEYSYSIEMGPKGALMYRPLIDVEIMPEGKKESIRVTAMIDSGTDGTVFHADIAK